jgi:pyrroline-5-carboxylate reductase
MNELRGLAIGFIGAGKMGAALIAGLRRAGVPGRRVLAADPDAAARRRAARMGARVTSDPCRVACAADVLVLAVKPQQMAGVLGPLTPCLAHRPLVVSIAAGVTLRWLQRRLPGCPVVRVMPNLPATVGCGFAALAAGRRVRPRHLRVAEALLGASGAVCRLPERHLDAVTAVSGSGPAYVLYLVASWQRAAQELGLPRGVAEQAIRRTLAGTLALWEASGLPPAALIRQVASKGGTTEAALRQFARGRVGGQLRAGIRAAARRSRALAWS